MNKIKINMINKAIEKYKKIYPCSKADNFDECFTKENNKLLFWFNTEDKSTHILIENIE